MQIPLQGQLSMIPCPECGKECKLGWLDFGIGMYEFWGTHGSDKDERLVSLCCDAESDDYVWMEEEL